MGTDNDYNQLKNKIVAHLKTVEGKGVDTTVNIAKAIGVHRREASKVLSRMEQDGMVQSAGVTAGVVGYKLKG